MNLVIVICAVILATSGLAIALAAALGSAAAKEDARRSRGRRGLAPIAEAAAVGDAPAYDMAAHEEHAGSERRQKSSPSRAIAEPATRDPAPSGARSSYAGLALVRATISFVPPLPRPGVRGGTLRFPTGLST